MKAEFRQSSSRVQAEFRQSSSRVQAASGRRVVSNEEEGDIGQDMQFGRTTLLSSQDASDS